MNKHFFGQPGAPLTFSTRDRVLVMAVHPDDGTLAAGGLLQRTRAAGASVRVLFTTDGENNPWPQRLLERRWRLTAADRARWGERRRGEARRALEQLGIAPGCARFLGLPGLGLTRALLKADKAALQSLIAALAEYEPTVLVYPSGADLHPDHNALHVLVRLAIRRLAEDYPQVNFLRELHYVIHGCENRVNQPRGVTLALPPAEQAAKRKAILCHASQLLLSRKRFLAHAGPVETFSLASGSGRNTSVPPHEAQEVTRRGNQLVMRFRPPAHGGPLRWTTVWLAMETARLSSLRWSLPPGMGHLPVRDEVTGVQLGAATGRMLEIGYEISLPMAEDFWPVERVSVRLHRSTVFGDQNGWREFNLTEIPVQRRRSTPQRPLLAEGMAAR